MTATDTRPTPPPTQPPRPTGRTRRIGSTELLAIGLLLVILGRGPLLELFDSPRMQTWTTVFVAIVIQAMPFLVFGVLLSAVITVFVPPSFFTRVLPRKPGAAVPVASAAGLVLPGCECGSVPVAGALVRRGVSQAAAFTFLLAAPAINPIVLVATAVAFPGDPEMVLARFVASALAAMIMGWLWLWLGRTEWIKFPRRPDVDGAPRWQAFFASCRHDLMHAGGFLVLGGMMAATVNVVVPPEWLQAVADQPLLSVLALALLAVLLSICSEADAFIAASLSQFSLTARLTFLVVGPMVDLKLYALQAGTFGRRFAIRFSITTFVVCVLISVGVGMVVL